MVWVKDLREKLRTGRTLERALIDPIQATELSVISGPSVMVPPERHRGEWCIRIWSTDGKSKGAVEVTLSRLIQPRGFELRLVQSIAKRRHLRVVPAPKERDR